MAIGWIDVRDYDFNCILLMEKQWSEKDLELSLDLDEYSEEVYEEEQPESLKGLVITACCLLAAIGGVLAWWLVRFF